MRFAFLIFVLFISVSSFSQSAAKAEKIKKFMDASGYSKMLQQSMASMFDVYEQNYPSADSTFWIEFRKEIKLDDLSALMIPIYDKYFNESDLDALVAFYSSPAGIKIRDAQPLIIRDATAAGAEWGKGIGEKVIKRLQEKGYQTN